MTKEYKPGDCTLIHAGRRTTGRGNIVPVVYPIEEVNILTPNLRAVETLGLKVPEGTRFVQPNLPNPSKDLRKRYTEHMWLSNQEKRRYVQRGLHRGWRTTIHRNREFVRETQDELQARMQLAKQRGTRTPLMEQIMRERCHDVGWRFPLEGPRKGNRAIGVEIEFSGDEDDRYDMQDSMPLQGTVGEDCSVSGYGHEVRVLTCEKHFRKHLQKICKVINSYEHRTQGVGAGLHVHLDIRAMTEEKAKQRAARLFVWLITFQGFVPRSRREASYSRQRFGRERYNMVHTYQIGYKDSIEVRMHTGSTNPHKIINWIELLLAIEKTPFPKKLFLGDMPRPTLGAVFAPLAKKLGRRRTEYWYNRYALFNNDHNLDEEEAPLSPSSILELADEYSDRIRLRKELYAAG